MAVTLRILVLFHSIPRIHPEPESHTSNCCQRGILFCETKCARRWFVVSGRFYSLVPVPVLGNMILRIYQALLALLGLSCFCEKALVS